MKKIILSLLLSLIFTLSYAQEHEYIPFVEEGKEWHYTHKIGFMWGDDYYPSNNVMLKMQGDTVINDISYKKVYSYTNWSSTPDNNSPYGFIREDCEKQIIYGLGNIRYDYTIHMGIFWLPNRGMEEYTIFDMQNPSHSSFDTSYGTYDFKLAQTVKTITGTDYHGYTWDCFGSTGIYLEGLGFVSEDIAGDLFGITLLISGGQGYLPYIYCIKNGKGETLFYNESNTVSPITTVPLTLKKIGNDILFSATALDNEYISYEICNMQGIIVIQGQTKDKGTVDIANLPKGIYIVRAHTSNSTTQIKFTR